jgi:hypothetical protein
MAGTRDQGRMAIGFSTENPGDLSRDGTSNSAGETFNVLPELIGIETALEILHESK